MHVMGVRGHPAGQTVLSYFPWKIDGLLPLDRVMLRAWYNPRMQGGMTPFESLPILADELVASVPVAQRAAAMKTRDAFYTNTIREMNAYANGTGDVPAIVKRSGKSTPEGIRYGRAEMSYFLGIAYLEGATVQRDATQAVRWLERASAMGNRGAQAKLGAFK
jgi:hypothetical protein